MTNTALSSQADLVRLSSEIVSAYVCRNAVPTASLPELIAAVHAALGTLAKPAAIIAPEPVKPSPAEIRRSNTPEALISFLDGRSYQTLKRHLNRHGLTPADYRVRFGLPQDYPMVASAYAMKRSELAKFLGLGSSRKRRDALAAQPSDPAPVEPSSPDPVLVEPKRRGRPKTKAVDAISA